MLSTIGNGGPLWALAGTGKARQPTANRRSRSKIAGAELQSLNILIIAVTPSEVLARHQCSAHFHGLKQQPHRCNAKQETYDGPGKEDPDWMLGRIVFGQPVCHQQ